MSSSPPKKKRSYHCPNPQCKLSFPSNEQLKRHMKESARFGSKCYLFLHYCGHCNKPFVHKSDLEHHLIRSKKCNANELSIDEDTTITNRTLQAAGNSLLTSGDARGYNFEAATLNQIRNQNQEFYLHSLENRSIYNSRFQLAHPSHKLNDVAHSKNNLLRNAYNEIDHTGGDTTFVTFLDDLEATNEEEEEELNQQHPPPPQVQIHGSILDHIHQKNEWDFSNGKNPIKEILDADIDEDVEIGLHTIDRIKDDLLRSRANISSSPIQRALIKLYKMVFKLGGESLYNDIVDWAIDHYTDIESLAKRGTKPNIQTIVKEEVYGSTYKHLFQPKVNSIIMSSGRRVNISTISFSAALADLLVSRKSADVAVPTEDDHTYYDELRSGSWWTRANNILCTQPHEAMEPITGFIDAVALGINGRRSMIPAMFTLSSFKTSARQNEDNWRVFAFIDHKNQLSSLPKNSKAATQKRNEYHEIMSVVFMELMVLQKYGFQWTSKNFDGSTTRQKIIVPIQLLVGDCEGAGELCGKIPSYLRTVPCLCRSCDVPHHLGSDSTRRCNYLKHMDMMQKSVEELKELSFYKIDNPFYEHLCFGHDEAGVFGCTPSEVLHQFEQGINDYLIDVILSQLKGSTSILIDSICKYTCDSFSAQSERNFPSLLAFRKGLSTTAKLTGKERFARLVMLQIIFCCTDFVKYITTKKNQKQSTTYGIEHWQQVLWIIEETLILHQVMKSGSIAKRILHTSTNSSESKFQTRIRKYMAAVTTVLPRHEGNGWNFVKFHELLHIEKNIIKHGAPSNSDSSRCEAFGKSFGKEIARRTQQSANTMGIQSAEKYCDWIATRRVNILLNVDKNSENKKEKKEGLYGSQFSFTKQEDSFTWKSSNTERWLSFDRDELNALHAFLFTKQNTIGCIGDEDIVHGFTEYKKDGIIFRAHPLFNSNRPWFDWCYINWGEELGNKVARICMFFDLSECNVSYSGNAASNANRLREIQYVMIQSVSDTQFDGGRYHLRTRLGERIGLERQRRIVPLDCISGPTFVKTNDVGMVEGELPPFDNTIIRYAPIDEWHKHFI